MKMNQIIQFGLLFTMLFKYILCQNPPALPKCEDQPDCFECSLGKPENANTHEYCEYDPSLGTCFKGSHNGPFDPFYLQWSKCTDKKSEDIQTKYCGVTYKERNKDSKELFTLNLVDGKYGRKRTLCQYTFVNDDEKANTFVNVQISKNVGMQMQILLEATYFNGTKANALVDKYNYYVLINTCREANLYYFGTEDFAELPFQIIVYGEKPGISITLIVTIVLVVLACLVCSISVYVFSKRNSRRTQSQQQGVLMMQNGVMLPVGETEESLRKKKMKQMHILLNETIIPITYTENLGEMNQNCTVCFENYDNTSNVCVTECKHVFHYDCLKSWLNKNILNAKCPNCNYLLLPDINDIPVAGGENGMVPMQSVPFVSHRSNLPNTVIPNQNPNVAYNSYQPNAYNSYQPNAYSSTHNTNNNRQARAQNNNFVEGGGNGIAVVNNTQSNRSMRNNQNHN